MAYSLTLNIYGELVRAKGDLLEARRAYQEGLVVALELEDHFRKSFQVSNLGLIGLQAILTSFPPNKANTNSNNQNH